MSSPSQRYVPGRGEPALGLAVVVVVARARFRVRTNGRKGRALMGVSGGRKDGGGKVGWMVGGCEDGRRETGNGVTGYGETAGGRGQRAAAQQRASTTSSLGPRFHFPLALNCPCECLPSFGGDLAPTFRGSRPRSHVPVLAV
ncbi:hypothetical protein JMJ77_0001633, partial [Colletotrichum scovillei]